MNDILLAILVTCLSCGGAYIYHLRGEVAHWHERYLEMMALYSKLSKQVASHKARTGT